MCASQHPAVFGRGEIPLLFGGMKSKKLSVVCAPLSISRFPGTLYVPRKAWIPRLPKKPCCGGQALTKRNSKSGTAVFERDEIPLLFGGMRSEM